MIAKNKKTLQEYWFGRKRYGYGWGMPISWQGWLALVLYLATVLLSSVLLLHDAPDDTFTIDVVYFIGLVSMLTTLFILIARKHAPKPKWQWVNKSKDEN